MSSRLWSRDTESPQVEFDPEKRDFIPPLAMDRRAWLENKLEIAAERGEKAASVATRDKFLRGEIN